MDAWWTAQQAGLIGGIGGGAIGMMGAMVGSMAGLAARGKAKGLMVGMFVTMIGVGAVLLVVGIVATVQGQPRHVYYPLLLGGFICGAVFGGLFPVVMMRYKAAEARRMEAEQLRRS